MTDPPKYDITDRLMGMQQQIDALTRLVHQLQDRYYLLRDEFLAHEQRPPEVK